MGFSIFTAMAPSTPARAGYLLQPCPNLQTREMLLPDEDALGHSSLVKASLCQQLQYTSVSVDLNFINKGFCEPAFAHLSCPVPKQGYCDSSPLLQVLNFTDAITAEQATPSFSHLKMQFSPHWTIDGIITLVKTLT